MIFYIATDENGRRHLVGTQADARAIDKEFVQHDIPVDKPNLMPYVQALLSEIDELRAFHDATAYGEPSVVEPQPTSMLSGCMDFTEPAPPPPPPPAPSMSIEEQILAADGNEFGRILQATLERLGELRHAGWSALRGLVSNHPRSRTSIERGLGYLVLDTRLIEQEAPPA